MIGDFVTPGFVAGGTGFGVGTNGTVYGGFQAPDVVANLRVDQAWGSAQIMGALHDVNLSYYGRLGITDRQLAAAMRMTNSVGRSAPVSS